jgi:hypothetical protein
MSDGQSLNNEDGCKIALQKYEACCAVGAARMDRLSPF